MSWESQFWNKLKVWRTLFLCFAALFPLSLWAQTDNSSKVPEIPKSAPAVTPNPLDLIKPISLEEAINLAEKQASNYAAAELNSRLVREDIKHLLQAVGK